MGFVPVGKPVPGVLEYRPLSFRILFLLNQFLSVLIPIEKLIKNKCLFCFTCFKMAVLVFQFLFRTFARVTFSREHIYCVELEMHSFTHWTLWRSSFFPRWDQHVDSTNGTVEQLRSTSKKHADYRWNILNHALCRHFKQTPKYNTINFSS